MYMKRHSFNIFGIPKLNLSNEPKVSRPYLFVIPILVLELFCS